MFKHNIISPAAVLFVLLAGVLSACGGAKEYRVAYAYTISAPSSASRLITMTIPAGDRYLTRGGVSITNGALPAITVITPGGINTPGIRQSPIVNFQFTLSDPRWDESLKGIIAARNVYVADFPDKRCDNVIFTTKKGTILGARGYRFVCRNNAKTPLAAITVHKTKKQLHGICWRDIRRVLMCGNLRFHHNASGIVVL